MRRLSDDRSKSGGWTHAEDTRERGLALLVVLWIVASAALLVSAFNATVRSGASFVASEVQLAKTEALLDAGVEIAASKLLGDKENRQWSPDGQPHAVSFAGTDLSITVSDPNGLVDLNQADGELLIDFFRMFSGSESEALKIRDAVLLARGEDAGQDAAKKPGVAASKPAQAQKSNVSLTAAKPTTAEQAMGLETAKPKNRSFAFIDPDQVRQLDGMTLKLYRAIAPYMTVYSKDGRINLTTAPAEVLQSVPNLTRIDVSRVRDAMRSSLNNEAALADVKQRAGALASDEAGPAYIISVKVAGADGRYQAGKLFVIAVGLDPDAPYRLLSKKTLALRN